MDYYMTCFGTNEVGQGLTDAKAGFAKLTTGMNEVGGYCDTLPLETAASSAELSIADVEAAVDCQRIQDTLLSLTRDAICTHAVDGLYFMWVVQACVGCFMVVALIIMRLV